MKLPETFIPEKNTDKKIEQLLKKEEQKKTEAFDYSKQYLLIKNIRCTDADNRIIEQYDELLVAKEFTFPKSSIKGTTNTYDAIKTMEKKGMFLPSLALTCNILAALYENRNNEAADKLLKEYFNRKDDYEFVAQNTVVDWEKNKVIHYPRDDYFLNGYGGKNVNLNREETVRALNPKGFQNLDLEEAVCISPFFEDYIKNSTGLQNPGILTWISRYYESRLSLWVNSMAKNDGSIGTTWIDHGTESLNINLFNYLSVGGIARGVKKPDKR